MASSFELLLSSLCGCWQEPQCQAQHYLFYYYYYLFLRKALDEEQQRVAYYPNSDSKFQRFKKAFQGVEERGAQPMQTDGFKTAPWLLKTGLTPQEVDNDNNAQAFQLL